MLRVIFVALVVANLAYFVWARGEAEAVDGASEREPQRLGQQVKPQLLQIRRPGSPAATAPAPAPAPADAAPSTAAADGASASDAAR